MEFGAIIKELLNISKVKQTDLSQALGYSTSEMSKYISGNRLPPARGMKTLVSRSAAVFASALWDEGQVNELRTLFPLLHDIKSSQDLDSFLRQAISLSYRYSRMKSEEGQDSIVNTSMVLHGWEAIYHHLLINLSFVLLQQKRDLNIYFTLDLFLAFIRTSPMPRLAQGGHSITVHVLFNPNVPESHLTLRNLESFLSHLRDAGSLVQFEAWVADEEAAPQSFCFVEGAFALLLTGLLQGSPLGTHIEEPKYMMEMGWLMRRLFSHLATYPHQEALDEVRADRKNLLKTLKTCQVIYAFGNFGFLVERSHLEGMEGETQIKDFMAEAMSTLMRLPIPMLINASAVEHFTQTHATRMPLMGDLRFDIQDQVAYLASYQQIAQEGKSVSIFLTKSEFPSCAILDLKDTLLIYVPGQDLEQEQFITLPKRLCGRLIPGLEVFLRKESIPLDKGLLENYLSNLADSGMTES